MTISMEPIMSDLANMNKKDKGLRRSGFVAILPTLNKNKS